MCKFVGFADHETIKGVAGIELVVAALKIELGLLDAGNHRGGRQGLVIVAEILHLHVGSANLVKNRFNDLAVGASQNLAKNSAGDLHVERFAFGSIEAGRLEPGGEGVDADPGLHVF